MCIVQNFKNVLSYCGFPSEQTGALELSNVHELHVLSIVFPFSMFDHVNLLHRVVGSNTIPTMSENDVMVQMVISLLPSKKINLVFH